MISCHSTKKISQEEMREKADQPVEKVTQLKCDFNGIIMVSDDPHCGVLIQLTNKTVIQPIGFPDSLDFVFEDNQPVRFSYKILEDVSTDCKEAIGVAEITCLVKDRKLQTGKSNECQDVIDVFKVKWMKDLLNSMDARKITKMDYREEKAYKFESPRATIYVDCYGNELCRIRAGENEQCAEVISQMSNEYVILVVDY